MYFRKLLLVVMVVALTLTVNTMAFSACSTNSCVGTIQRLYTNSAGLVYIATDGDERALDCESPASVYITLPADDENFDRKYALLLAAALKKQQVGLRIINGSENCALSYVYVDIN